MGYKILSQTGQIVSLLVILASVLFVASCENGCDSGDSKTMKPRDGEKSRLLLYIGNGETRDITELKIFYDSNSLTVTDLRSNTAVQRYIYVGAEFTLRLEFQYSDGTIGSYGPETWGRTISDKGPLQLAIEDGKVHYR